MIERELLARVASELASSSMADEMMILAADPQPEVILPFPQRPWASLNLSLRTEVDPHSVTSEVRRQIAAIDKDQPITNVQTLEEVLDSARAQPRTRGSGGRRRSAARQRPHQ